MLLIDSLILLSIFFVKALKPANGLLLMILLLLLLLLEIELVDIEKGLFEKLLVFKLLLTIGLAVLHYKIIIN